MKLKKNDYGGVGVQGAIAPWLTRRPPKAGLAASIQYKWKWKLLITLVRLLHQLEIARSRLNEISFSFDHYEKKKNLRRLFYRAKLNRKVKWAWMLKNKSWVNENQKKYLKTHRWRELRSVSRKDGFISRRSEIKKSTRNWLAPRLRLWTFLERKKSNMLNSQVKKILIHRVATNS